MTTANSKNKLFPVFLKLESLRLLIIGGGTVAEEKLKAVLSNSPDTSIKIIARELSDAIKKQTEGKKNIKTTQKEFTESDLEGIDVVIAAVNNPEASMRIQRLCRKKNILVNVADTPVLCDFYLGSIVQKGQLKLAISTNGKSPTAAKRIKEMLHNALPDELDELIEQLHLIRNQLKGDFQQKVSVMNEITKTMTLSSNS
ncbi:MAG: bifunctional precorrin-2 dehydrogenase/sirohydrochlorin ferrochelatase [Bacteroidetes bacterium]|nr:bifunctional precorrin-2 dehydrogenase/sirohydrochlorin ferrochelatase [Bacteroidota bacterium]